MSHDDINNCMIRVALQKEMTNNEKSELKAKLIRMGARSVRWMDIQQTQAIEQEAVEETYNTEQDLFKNWIEKDHKNICDLDMKILHKCNNEVVAEGDELYSLENAGV